MRRFGETARRGQVYTDRPGIYAVLADGDSLLITHQAAPVPEFQLPGGGIDPGEQPLHALHREVREETGWSIASPRRLGVFQRFAWMPEYRLWARKICHIYLARPVQCLGAPSEAGHIALWVPARDAATTLDNPGERDFVRRWLRARG